MAPAAGHRFIETLHGRIHCLEAGQGATPLILLHSNGCSAYEYVDVIGPLAEKRRVLAWDMPGHGDSGPIGRHYGIADYTDTLVQMMDGLDITSAVVLGSSVGGTICIDMGARHAGRLAGLVIVETPTRSFDAWEAIWPMVEATFATMPVGAAEVAPRFTRSLTPELLARWNYDRNKAGSRVMMDVMWAIRQFDVTASLPKIKTPSLAVFGDKGPVLDSQAIFARYLPAAAQTIMPNCGHFPMIDDPAGFVRVVDAFASKF